MALERRAKAGSSYKSNQLIPHTMQRVCVCVCVFWGTEGIFARRPWRGACGAAPAASRPPHSARRAAPVAPAAPQRPPLWIYAGSFPRRSSPATSTSDHGAPPALPSSRASCTHAHYAHNFRTTHAHACMHTHTHTFSVTRDRQTDRQTNSIHMHARVYSVIT